MAPNSDVILITGATDGIGQQTAFDLARGGARVLVHGRNAERALATRTAIEKAVGRAQPEPVIADLSSLKSVRALVDELDRRGLEVGVLVNNAGVFMNDEVKSADGFEMTLAVNHLAPFLLTHLLLSRPTNFGFLKLSGLRRIVNVASIAHTRGQLRLDDLSFEKRGFDAYATYAASKLANVLFTIELARRLGTRATVNALHPGVVSTKLLTEGFGVRGSDTLERAAATSVYLASSPEVEGQTGGYYVSCRPAPASPGDGKLSRDFYEHSAALVGVEPIPEPA